MTSLTCHSSSGQAGSPAGCLFQGGVDRVDCDLRVQQAVVDGWDVPVDGEQGVDGVHGSLDEYSTVDTMSSEGSVNWPWRGKFSAPSGPWVRRLMDRRANSADA